MSNFELLWVPLNDPCSRSDPPAEFTRTCHVRVVSASQLWATIELAAHVDAVCFDITYPDADNLKLISGTKAKYPSVPLLLAIEQHSAELLIWALRSRIFDVLTKPIVASEVAKCLERLGPVLKARRAQSQRQSAVQAPVVPQEVRYHALDSKQHKFKSVLAYIGKHYASGISETELARSVDMSTCSFSRSFHSFCGMSFREYVNNCRFTNAKRLLANPRIPVNEVAAMVGFTDPSYFARQFRKSVGVTPTEFRTVSASNPVLQSEAIAADTAH